MPIELKIPAVGESITEVEVGEWTKSPGDSVRRDETVVTLESEKATIDLPAPAAGTLARILKKKGETAAIGEVIGYLEESGKAPGSAADKSAAPQPRTEGKKLPPQPDGPDEKQAAPPETRPRVMPAAQRVLAEHQLRPEDVEPTGPGGRLLKEDVLRHVEQRGEAKPAGAPALPEPPPQPPEARRAPTPEPAAPQPGQASARPAGPREEESVPMSRLRRTVAERLVAAQQNAALLTTFNEIDMSGVMTLRKEFGEAFQARYGTKLGFMSFFVKASVDALRLIPQVNAEIRGTDIVYRNYHDIGVAIGGGKGLVVPILRNAERMSFAEIELAIADFAARARQNKLGLEELQGGTFTISNGGVYGSLLSTPIVNPPQSGILGMHAIQERPIAHQGNVVIRPMMYVALTYDHRIVDGREAVTFLKRIKDVVENPTRILLEV
jgi:2-oxoglutarate dehydrogenase E2 component (dihydrolipoamide succinyltransferase)